MNDLSAPIPYSMRMPLMHCIDAVQRRGGSLSDLLVAMGAAIAVHAAGRDRKARDACDFCRGGEAHRMVSNGPAFAAICDACAVIWDRNHASPFVRDPARIADELTRDLEYREVGESKLDTIIALLTQILEAQQRPIAIAIDFQASVPGTATTNFG